MINNKRSYTEYNITSPTTDFAIGFENYGVGAKDIIEVTLNGVLVESLGYTVRLKNAQVLEVTPAIEAGTVRLQRVTAIDSSFHKFTAGALFTAKSMDENFEQIRHSQQEVKDGFLQAVLKQAAQFSEYKQTITAQVNTSLTAVNQAVQAFSGRVGALEGSVTGIIRDLYQFGDKAAQYTKDAVKTAITDAQVNIGFITIDSFEFGATLTQRNQALRHAADGKLYRWAGDLPKVVPADSTPTSTGGFGANAWLEVSDVTLRQEIVAGGLVTDALIKTVPKAGSMSVARSQAAINAERVSLLDFIPIDLHEGIRAYTYADNIAPYMQKAVDYCTANNKELHCPAGGYMIDPATNTNLGVYLIRNWGQDKNLIVSGAGQGLTVFREADGATTIGGRYTKMFYIQAGTSAAQTEKFGNVIFRNMTLDKNGRSNTNPLRQAKIDAGLPITTADRFPFEQAHTIGLGGVGNYEFQSIVFENIELLDKIGGGISLSAMPTVYVNKVTFTSIRSRKNGKVELFGGDGTFGDRGCIEAGGNNGVIDFNTCDVQYSQIEPVMPSSPTLQRYTNVNGGKIDALEFTDSGGYSFVNIVNLVCSYKLLTRGIDANITNSTFLARNTFSGGMIKISNSIIKLIYDEETNKVTPLNYAPLGVNQGYGEMWLSDVDIVIDSPDPDVRPSGYLMGGGTATQGSKVIKLNNVRFDSRAEISVSAYGTGDWHITNSYLYGASAHINLGSYVSSGNVYGGDIELDNNKYLGTGKKLNFYKNAEGFTFKISGSYPFEDFYKTIGAYSSDGKILGFPALYSDSKPTGYSPKGQEVINTNPVKGGYEKWIKLEEGHLDTTWVGVGLIEGAATSGTTAQRPTGVAVGFTYFDTTLGIPVYFKSTGVWVDSTGVTV